ncbi:hypothetical protein [Spirilliplanes yamanashiensis]|uniref:Uncharacterized protein n=1 Tax=Spirilliplanes yamanashiensis TaxID=42233 RepID=A0A8J3YEI2_9ACTN|nr:hypothetical protein [Spirilliplanes yamanashiensis]MDP9815261.1 hypothetical protein [Spirilliplanes yamanashiensis]GIJ06470.1 hypothetical protein Sya03_58220 [Spirilliplanes yamanashiensis]
MRHPTDGTLRRLLDEPAGVADADREHVAGCAVCRAGLAAAQRDAALTGAALDMDADVDVDRAWSRLSAATAATAADGRRPQTAAAGSRWRTALRSPVIAGVAVVTLLAGAGAAAAADWLPIFRTERIAPISISQADLLKLPDLSGYGDLEVTEEVQLRGVADAAAARQATGLDVPRVDDLPRGVTGEPSFQVGDRASAVFTFSEAKARQAAAAAGHTLPPAPAGLDGSSFRLTVGPGVAAVWQEARGLPAMLVARVVAPKGYSTGVPFETARDYLLSLSGLPEHVKSQLRTFSADGRTLPVHVLAEELTSASADVDGVPATVFSSRDGALTAVVWVQDGVVTAVAGSLSTEEVLSVARDLEDR